MKYKLYGDGVHDDTDAIQELLDSGSSCVYLPVPEKSYLISRTLKIHSQQELRLDRFTLIRLAAGANCLMITNSDYEDGNCNVSVSGGIWDANNKEQAPNPQMVSEDMNSFVNPDACKRIPVPDDYPVDPTEGRAAGWANMRPFHPDRYLGLGMRFYNVDGFELRDLTVKDPVTYGILCGKVTNFTIKGITFDYNEGNPSPNNMDGIHFEGLCRNGYIGDLKGACYDDLVAFTADDVSTMSKYFAPIENIVVDGIFADRCHSAVRLLSFGHSVKNIVIRNVFGSYYRYAIGFTHYLPAMEEPGTFDNIVLENLFISKALPLDSDWNRCPDWGLIWVEGGSRIGSLRISEMHREETTTSVPDIQIDAGGFVEQLTVDGTSLVNRLPDGLVHISNSGVINKLYTRNFTATSADGAGEITEIANNGKIGRYDLR